MPKEKFKGLYGSDREVSWPDKNKKPDEEKAFVAIRDLLQEYQDLTLSIESDRLVLAHLLTRMMKKKEYFK